MTARVRAGAVASNRAAGALLLGLALAGPARDGYAGPPFQTDDPNVVALGHYEALLFYRQTLAADRRSGVLPGLELHYGAVDNLELDLVAPIAFHAPPRGDVRRGYGDTELGLKYSLLEESESTPLVGFAPKLDLPTGNGDRGLGNGGAATFLPIWLQKSRGDLRGYGGGGYWIHRGPGNRNYWFVGVETEYRVSERWVLGAELFHTTPQTTDQRSSTGFNAGGSYALDERVQWLFSVGRGVRNAGQTDRVSSYLGCQLSF